MTLQRLHTEFPNNEENFILFFISAGEGRPAYRYLDTWLCLDLDKQTEKYLHSKKTSNMHHTRSADSF